MWKDDTMIQTEEQKKMSEELKYSTEVDFDVGQEPWITIKLADGGELKARVIIKGVRRLRDDELTGEPRYNVAFEHLVRMTKRPNHLANKRLENRGD
jgi:hypothetical protein